MNPWASTVQNEKGMVLPLALFALVALSAFVLAFVSMGAMEPQVSRNHTDTTQARYAAEAGMEWAYDQLALAPSYSKLLQTNPVAGSNPQTAWLTPAPGGVATQVTLPGLTANFGTYTVQIRNDVLNSDQTITGLPPEGNATTDNNGVLIVTATGTYNGVQRQIQVVMRRVSLPPFPGAYNVPGFQADLTFRNNTFDIDGRDYVYKCTQKCSDDPSKQTWEYVVNSDQSKMKFGIAVQPGVQQSTPGKTYEQNAGLELDNKNYGNVKGKSQVSGAPTTGLNTVAAPSDPSEVLNPAVMQNFLTQLAQFSGTTVIQSNLKCAQNIGDYPVGILMSGNSVDPSKPTLTNACGLKQTLDLGDKNNPKLVYFRGDPDPTSQFVGVLTDGKPIKGAGLLIVEDGDLYFKNKFDWDGIVIVTGKYVSSSFEQGSQVNIYGATVSNETEPCEGGCPQKQVFYEGWFQGAAANLRYSQQTLDAVQRALLFRMTTWREL